MSDFIDSMTEPQRFQLRALQPANAVLLGARVTRAARAAQSLEEAAGGIVSGLYEILGDSTSDGPSVALARFYRTISYADLEAELQEVAAEILREDGGQPWAAMKCLTLMGSAGLEPTWNSRHTSARHRVIPLLSPTAVERLPMASRLISELGMSVANLVETGFDPAAEPEVGRARIFHVEEADGSPYIPDQEGFVRRYGIRSVIGFGSSLRSGDLWAVVLFTRVSVSLEVARLFRMLATDIKIAILPVLSNRFFAA